MSQREELKRDKVNIGTIVLDAVFTPIKKLITKWRICESETELITTD